MMEALTYCGEERRDTFLKQDFPVSGR